MNNRSSYWVRRCVLSLSLAIGLLVGTNTASAQLGGEIYTGQWDNLTFLSSGAASFVATAVGPNVTAIMDLDGGVFGGGDPGPVVLTGILGPTGVTLTATGNPVYGDLSLTVTLAGIITGSATNIPNPSIISTDFVGTIDATTLFLDYTVNFDFGDPAVGVINATVPEPASLALLGLGGAVLMGRRR